MRSREKDAAQMAVKRQAFLDAALELFVAKGIEAVSLDSISIWILFWIYSGTTKKCCASIMI